MPDYTHAPEPLGVPTRRAALRLLDAVLRRGESLESALPAATRAIHGPKVEEALVGFLFRVVEGAATHGFPLRPVLFAPLPAVHHVGAPSPPVRTISSVPVFAPSPRRISARLRPRSVHARPSGLVPETQPRRCYFGSRGHDCARGPLYYMPLVVCCRVCLPC